ncbi:hypothetical protein BC938DRAFT_482673 [Jimgerdemannia flammicorona]|uniref:Uncharacterized protein n=1 Tax=Jimgerdemannia flammicorona TaxID=994334 RepID=A0A433QDH4_9FUNG|nr:hypothetical protein BC938DRAFT_482673 [Jimgerdemannia flammicorona]
MVSFFPTGRDGRLNLRTFLFLAKTFNRKNNNVKPKLITFSEREWEVPIVLLRLIGPIVPSSCRVVVAGCEWVP